MASDTGDIRGMYEAVKQRRPSNRSLVKSSLTAISRWKGGRSSTWRYMLQRTVSEEVLNSIVNLSVMEELDKEPTQEELSKAIDSLESGNSSVAVSGTDRITPEVIS